MKIQNIKYFITILFISLISFSAIATDTVLNVYKNDNSVEKFYLNGITNLTTNTAENLLVIQLKVGKTININLGVIDSITYTEENISIPSISTILAEYDKTLEQVVCGINVTKDGGLTVVEKGLLWSKTAPPSYNTGNKLAYGKGTGQFYSVVSDILATEAVYVRPYALNSKGLVMGDPQKVSEITGNVTFTLDIDKNKYPRQYALIEEAMDSACYYYNHYTPFEANVHVYYNEGIPTAQAGYHGSIGFGANERYMYVGTAMHEMAHFFGSGTTTIWKSLMVGGIWQGESGKAVCLELTGDVLKGDNNSSPVHYWPTGINQREEIKSAQDLVNHAKVVKAMLVDDCKLPTKF